MATRELPSPPPGAGPRAEVNVNVNADADGEVKVNEAVDVEQPQRSVMALFTGGVPLLGPPAPGRVKLALPPPGIRRVRRP
jgi:hypothetical protein